MKVELNKELPREEQLRIVLQNYDKKVAELNTLKKENEELKKQLQQKDVLYKNMLERFCGKNGTNDKFETLYKELLVTHKTLKDKAKVLRETNENLKKENAELLDSKREIVRKMQGIGNTISTVLYCITQFREKYNDGEPLDEVETPDSNAVVDNAPQTLQDFNLLKFRKYVNDIIASFKITGSLRGIATKGKQYGTRSMSKEQFFMFGLNNIGEISDDILKAIYNQVKTH